LALSVSIAAGLGGWKIAAAVFDDLTIGPKRRSINRNEVILWFNEIDVRNG
jgi:hypothetical protein